MKWRKCWPETLLALLALALGFWPSNESSASAAFVTAWPTQRKLVSRERVRDLWYHGFDNYMTYAFPQDELAPLSCKGRGPDFKDPQNWASNDVAGNFSLTLIDVVDTFVILDDVQGFSLAVRDIIDHVSFDLNTKPQVFETTIRVMGGLLSGHTFASRKGQPFYLPWYDGELLALALDLGNRLLPAFDTETGIPYARINLRNGVPKGESHQTCTAGAGSLILEFGTLSRMTGDDRFEKAAYKAYFALWNRKSEIGLVGNTINVQTGLWSQPEISGIGAGIDSFYEYALKWYVLSGEVEFLDVWHEGYAAVMRYSRAPDGFWFRNVDIYTGDAAYYTVDSLSSFWPGLQVLGGDVENAIKAHLTYWNLWKRFSGMPEVWDTRFVQATSFQYPLRPEFAESTWYLYRATRDPFYLEVGDRILFDLETRAKVSCGLAGIKDLRTNSQEDRMESFVLSETLKYLYLLFDENNLIHRDDSNYVFTTEGHLLTLDNKHLKPISDVRRRLRGAENLQCPAYSPPMVLSQDGQNGLRGGIRSRGDVEYARLLVGGTPNDADKAAWSPDGFCDVPHGELYSYDFILSPNGKVVDEDFNPGSDKLELVDDGFMLHNVTGVRAHIVSRLDGKGYSITRLGPHSVRSGQLVYVDDREVVLGPVDDTKDDTQFHQRQAVVNLRFNVKKGPMIEVSPDINFPLEATLTAFTSLFGGDPTTSTTETMRFTHHAGSRILFDKANHQGCLPYTKNFTDEVLVVHRGDCTFLEKLQRAKEAGALGVVVFSDGDSGLNPSIDQSEVEVVGDSLNDVALVVLPQTSAKVLMTMMDNADALGLGQIIVTVESQPPPPRSTEKNVIDDKRVLFLNGHPLTNTRLMV